MINENTIVISIITFLAVVGAIEGMYLLYRSMNVGRTHAVGKRLRNFSASGMTNEEAMSLLRKRMLSEVPIINRLLSAFPRSHSMDRMLVQSGVDLTVSRYILIQLSLALLLFLLLFFALDIFWFASLPIALLAGFYLPYGYIVGKTRERATAVSTQLPDALDYLARSLRAGNPFSAGLKQASLEMNDPIATEFATTFEELNFGVDIEDALEHLSQRTSSDEMRYFITAVLIQKSTGGNLAEVMNRLSSVMRARARTLREIRVLAAEMKLSANVLMALPFVVAGALLVLNPGYLSTLVETSLGFMVIGVQLLLMVTGYFIIQRMVNFRV